MKDKPVYFDDERKQLYWIEWEETGNNDIPHRHYISINIASNGARGHETDILEDSKWRGQR